MLRATGTRRRLAALLVPSFLVVHLVCFCLPPASAAAPRPVAAAHHAGHDCCPDQGRKAPATQHEPSCSHCGSARLGVAPMATSLTAPLVVPLALVPSPAGVVTPTWVRRLVETSRAGPPTLSPLRRKCVLLV